MRFAYKRYKSVFIVIRYNCTNLIELSVRIIPRNEELNNKIKKIIIVFVVSNGLSGYNVLPKTNLLK